MFRDKNWCSYFRSKEVKELAAHIPLPAGVFAKSSQALTKHPSHLLLDVVETLGSYGCGGDAWLLHIDTSEETASLQPVLCSAIFTATPTSNIILFSRKELIIPLHLAPIHWIPWDFKPQTNHYLEKQCYKLLIRGLLCKCNSNLGLLNRHRSWRVPKRTRGSASFKLCSGKSRVGSSIHQTTSAVQ